jgi:hypothetical protein
MDRNVILKRLGVGTEEPDIRARPETAEAPRHDSALASDAMRNSELERSSERLEAWLRRRLWIAVPLLVLILPLPWALGLANGSYLAATVAFVLVAVIFARAENPDDRILFVGFFGVFFILHQAVHLVLFWLGSTAGGPFLGPDSARYLMLSFEVAELGFPGDLFLASRFGSYDIAHLYLFGAAIELLDADLFCLQVINGGFMALVAGLTYSWSRIALPRYGTLLGAGVAFFPSSIVLTSLDLLKDPSVTFSVVLGIWALFKLTRAEKRTAQAVYVLIGALGLSYVHMTRFYLLTHIEIAIGCTLGVLWFHRIRGRRGGSWPGWRESRPGLGVSVVLLLVLAELGPWLLGWPLSPMFYLRSVQRVQDVPAMTEYAPGLIDQLAPSSKPAREATPASPEADPARRSPRTAGERSPQSSGGAGSDGAGAGDPALVSDKMLTTLRATLEAPDSAREGRKEANHEASADARPVAPDSPPTWRAEDPPTEAVPVEALGPLGRTAVRVLAGTVDLIRRFYGPFVWVVPERWSVERLLRREYLYYPGMLVWYALWPLIAGGILISGWKLLRGRGIGLGLGVITVYCVLSLAQYTVLNLSYRQRDILFPLLLVFALIGFSAFREHRVLRYAYGLYWVLIVGLAVSHLLLKYKLLGLVAG